MRCVQRRACPRPLHLNLSPTSTTPLINYDLLVVVVTASLAILLPLVYPESKQDPSPILWHFCTSALGAFFGLMAGIRIHPNT